MVRRKTHVLHHQQNKSRTSLTWTQSSEKSYSLPHPRPHPALEWAGLFFFLFFFARTDVFSSSSFFLMSKTWSLVIQHCRLLLPPHPRFLWMCASCWFCIPSQQVDWASVTSYIYIYTCTQHHMYPPNKIKKNDKEKTKKTNSVFTTLSVWSYKNLHDSPLKSLHGGVADRCEICSRFGSVLALGVTWNAALFHGEGAGSWGWAYLSPPPIKMGLFLWSQFLFYCYYYHRHYYYFFFKFTLCWKKSNWLQTLASAGPHHSQKTLECECISAVF